MWLALEKRFLPSNVWDSDSLTFWRERILFVICFTAVVLGPIALIPSLVLSFHEGLWSVILLDSSAYLTAVVILLSRNLPLKTRASVICLLLYSLGVGLLFVLGPIGAGYIWLFGASIIISTIIGLRAAILTFALNVFALLSVAIFILCGAPAWVLHIENALEKWLVMAVNFLLINSLVTITTALMLNGLKNALQKEQEASLSLQKSEERFILAMDASKDGIYDWNLVTNEIYYSPSWKRMLGYEQNEIKNEFYEWERLTDPEDAKVSWKMLNQVIEGKRERFEQEFKMRQKDGQWLDILSRANVFRDDKGNAVRVVGTHVDITNRKRYERTLYESDEKFSKAFQTSPYAITLSRSEDGKFIEVNNTFSLITGYSREEAFASSSIGLNLWVNEKDRQHVIDDLRAGRVVESREYQFRTKTDKVIIGLFSAQVLQLSQGHCILSSINDITMRKELESQLIQAQKMESVGRLAGGVAHDFNNMLGIILGYTEMSLDQVDPTEMLHVNLLEIRNAANRSADLTRQLLAFARKQTVAPKVIDLNEALEGMLKMLRRLIGEDIDLTWLPGRDLWPVKLDPSQIDQILANLCVNARDAISGVGKMTLETGNRIFDEDYCTTHPGSLQGEYVMLNVSDNGCGMDKETQLHIFEPFFTTKEMGKGTGLGLATVFGIVKQNNGFINVYSETEHGTTFTIYLPRHISMATQTQMKDSDGPAAHGNETILLVEDEPVILKMTTVMLERMGYTVVAAFAPGEAIRLAEAHTDHIHLVMTDVIMPEMNGRDLVRKLLLRYPDIKSLFMSGYTSNVIAHHGTLEPGIHFIQKPFSIQNLAAKVREVLDNANG